jgi:hypothetical protein
MFKKLQESWHDANQTIVAVQDRLISAIHNYLVYLKNTEIECPYKNVLEKMHKWDYGCDISIYHCNTTDCRKKLSKRLSERLLDYLRRLKKKKRRADERLAKKGKNRKSRKNNRDRPHKRKKCNEKRKKRRRNRKKSKSKGRNKRKRNKSKKSIQS